MSDVRDEVLDARTIEAVLREMKRHTHVRCPDDRDRCDLCGEDLGSDIHLRMGEHPNAVTRVRFLKTQPAPVSRVAELEAALSECLEELSNFIENEDFNLGGGRDLKGMEQDGALPAYFLRARQALTGSTPVGDVVGDLFKSGAVDALRNYGQADMDGIIVSVSREALEMTLDALDRLNGEAG